MHVGSAMPARPPADPEAAADVDMDDEEAESMARDVIGDPVDGESEELHRAKVQKLLRATKQAVGRRLRTGLGAATNRGAPK